MYLVGWAADVIATLYGRTFFHVILKLMARRRKDVGLGCRRDFNVVPTSPYIYVVITSTTIRCKNVVFIFETSWLQRCMDVNFPRPYNVDNQTL